MQAVVLFLVSSSNCSAHPRSLPCIPLLSPFPRFPLLPASAILIDANPFSETLVAKAHGRVDMVIAAVKSVLVLIASVRPVGVSTATVLAVVAVGAAVQLYAYITYMPYFSEQANKAYCSFAAAFAWACGCTLLAVARNLPAEQVEGFLFLFALPFVTHTGYMVAQRRLEVLKSSNADGIATSSACIVELKARQLLAAAQSNLKDGSTVVDKPDGGSSSASSFRRDGVCDGIPEVRCIDPHVLQCLTLSLTT